MQERAYKYPELFAVSKNVASDSLSVKLQSLCLPLAPQIRVLALVSSFAADLSRRKSQRSHTHKKKTPARISVRGHF